MVASRSAKFTGKGGLPMESIYKIIELVGTSRNSWEEAAKNAVETAGKSLEDLRIAEVAKLDMVIEKGKVVAYRTRVNVSFKYRSEG
jgi:flavin-binding protein dodecin